MDDQYMDELYRLMQNWARPHSGASPEMLMQLWYRQRGLVPPDLKGDPRSAREVMEDVMGKGPAYDRLNGGPQYDAVPRKQPALPQKFNSPMKSLYDMLQQQLGPMEKGVETGGYGPVIDPRVARKFVM